MTANEIPELGADFAGRVLRTADGIVARRRGAAAGAVSIALLALVSWVALTRAEGPPQPKGPNLAAVDAPQDDRTAALAYLFPDAQPVARFAADYSDDADDTADSDSVAPLDDLGDR